METVCINIYGMTCMRCVNKIQSVVSEIPGVSKIIVSLEDKKADVEYIKNIITPQEITDAINDIGTKFTASLTSTQPDEVRIAIEGKY